MVDGARDTDRLVRRTEMGVAGHLGSDGTAQSADLLDVGIGRRLREFPPDMELVRTLRCSPAAFHDQSGVAQMPGQVGKLGTDIAGVDVDDDRLMSADFAWPLSATVPGIT